MSTKGTSATTGVEGLAILDLSSFRGKTIKSCESWLYREPSSSTGAAAPGLGFGDRAGFSDRRMKKSHVQRA